MKLKTNSTILCAMTLIKTNPNILSSLTKKNKEKYQRKIYITTHLLDWSDPSRKNRLQYQKVKRGESTEEKCIGTLLLADDYKVGIQNFEAIIQ